METPRQGLPLFPFTHSSELASATTYSPQTPHVSVQYSGKYKRKLGTMNTARVETVKCPKADVTCCLYRMTKESVNTLLRNKLKHFFCLQAETSNSC